MASHNFGAQGESATTVKGKGSGSRAAAPFGPSASVIAVTPQTLPALQRSAGNAAVASLLAGIAAQRQPRPISVGPVRLNHSRVSLPIPGGVTLRGSVPAGQQVNWSLVAGTAPVASGSTISAAGVVTLSGGQAGGAIRLRADDPSGSGAFATSSSVFLIKAPGAISATAETGSAPATAYGANFRHTFTAAGGAPGSECEGGRVNEIFPGVPAPNATTHLLTTPFGPFTLTTNDPSSFTAGWGIDNGGQMTGDDHVTIGRRGVDLRPFIANASNPAPATPLPASFSVSQNLRSFTEPAPHTWLAAFATPPHVRGLREPTAGAPEFFVSANGLEHVDTYTGPPAVRNARPATPSVVASPAAPPRRRGAPPPAPVAANTVQIAADSTPGGTVLRFSIQGPALGCRINATTGLLTIGSTQGTVRVRVAEPEGRSFDEVTVTITAPPAPVNAPATGTPAPAGAGRP